MSESVGGGVTIVGVSPEPAAGRRARRLSLAIAVAAAALTGVLLAVTYSLHPLWWVAWIAPIPVLLVSARASGVRALWLGALAGAIGGVSLFAYLLEIGGLAAAALALVARAAQWAVVVWATNRALSRLPLLAAAFVAPASLAGIELLAASVSPHGSAGSLAYSQLDALPVVQLAALGGTSAITFAVMLGANLVVVFCLILTGTRTGTRTRTRTLTGTRTGTLTGSATQPRPRTRTNLGAGP